MLPFSLVPDLLTVAASTCTTPARVISRARFLNVLPSATVGPPTVKLSCPLPSFVRYSVLLPSPPVASASWKLFFCTMAVSVPDPLSLICTAF